jgi:hypothetical protein
VMPVMPVMPTMPTMLLNAGLHDGLSAFDVRWRRAGEFGGAGDGCLANVEHFGGLLLRNGRQWRNCAIGFVDSRFPSLSLSSPALPPPFHADFRSCGGGGDCD